MPFTGKITRIGIHMSAKLQISSANTNEMKNQKPKKFGLQVTKLFLRDSMNCKEMSLWFSKLGMPMYNSAKQRLIPLNTH